MKDSEINEFNALLSDIFAGYGEVITPGACRFYFAILNEFDIRDVAKAFFHLAKSSTSKKPPSAGEVHAQILGGNVAERSSFAWQEVLTAITRFGRYKSVCFTEPAINKVVEEMGWEYLCSKTSEELAFISHDFKKLFSSYCKTPPAVYPSHVRGLIEVRDPNERIEIRFVGDESRARLVYDQGVPPVDSKTLLAIR